MNITDIHTHAFPDALAPRAIAALEAECDEVEARLDGTVGALLASMDRAGIERSVVCSIATKPEQFDAILQWSREVESDRIVALPSVHPRDPLILERTTRVAEAGFRGIKLHPYYQDFFVDDEALAPFYARCRDLGLMVVLHTGFDIAFPRIRRADPQRIVAVAARFPRLRLVTTHLGAWMDWDNVERLMVGKPIYMEISYTLGMLPDTRVRDIVARHPGEFILFGTDSPWQDQAETLDAFRRLELGAATERAALCDNAHALLSG